MEILNFRGDDLFLVSQSINKYEDKILTIPNLLSFFRICLIPIFVWLYFCHKESGLSAIVFIVSGISDIADGIIARKFNMVSNFGKFFDPIADKLTQIVVMGCLIYDYPLLAIALAILAVKEILAAILNMITLKKTGFVVAAVWHGKLTTVSVYATIFIHIVYPLIAGNTIPDIVSKIFIIICICVMLLSATLYTISDIKTIKNKKNIE